jgi:DNA (cytosine-5)-methyltransferase 1
LDTLRLLPTPRATDGTKGCPAQRGSKGDLMLPSVVIAVTTPTLAPLPTHSRKETSRDAPAPGHTHDVAADSPTVDWGEYAAAVHRWELITGRPAPYPTQPGRHGRPVLAPPFVEWLMGLSVGLIRWQQVISADQRFAYVCDICRGLDANSVGVGVVGRADR